MTVALTRPEPTSTPSSEATLPRLLAARVGEHPTAVAFRKKELGIWAPITWGEYGDRVGVVAAGFKALGIRQGDRVAIHSENRPEWVVGDLAAESLGAIVVGVYPTNPAPEVQYLLRDSGARVLIAEDQEQLDKALEVLDSCPDLEHIVVIDPKGLRHYEHPKLVTFEALEAMGAKELAGRPGRGVLDELAAGTREDDVACIVYTSGTTGPPKGAMLTHRQTIVGAEAFVKGMGVDRSDTHVSYLPLCHLAEREWTLYIHLLLGITVNFAESVATVQRDIYEIAPTFFGAVPRIAEKMQASVEINMQDAVWIKRVNYRFWMRVGANLASERLAHGGKLRPLSKVKAALGWLFLYRALRERLGLKRVRHALVGAAAVAPEILEYFHAIGIRLIQVYGQTECGGVSHMHFGWDIKYDSVGKVVEGFEFRLDEGTDEILLRGAGVFAGYWNRPDATAATVDADGWLHTGDVGLVDADGHLHIVGRIKDIIITAGGKNISPQEIENKLKFSPYVREAIVIGEAKPYLTALIGIEYDTVGHWAEQRGIAYTTYGDLSGRPEVRDLVDDWVRHVNDEIAQVESIKKFRLLLKELDHEDDELTATQKVRRATVEAKFADLVDDMYASGRR